MYSEFQSLLKMPLCIGIENDSLSNGGNFNKD